MSFFWHAHDGRAWLAPGCIEGLYSDGAGKMLIIVHRWNGLDCCVSELDGYFN